MSVNDRLEAQMSRGATGTIVGLTATAAELNTLHSVTAGTVRASSGVVVDSNKDIASFRNVTGVNYDAGASGTAGSLDIFPTTASKGKISLVAADSAGDTTTTITNASQAGAVTYTIPDAGGSASFVMTGGTQTVGGAKTFSSAIVPTGGIAAGGGFAVSPRCWHTGGVGATQTTDGNDSTPSVTETYIAEVFVPANASITGIAVFNGSAVGTDKLVVALANSSGVPVANSALAGTTATGTDAYQKIDFTAPYAAVGPATYFVLLQCNGTTYRFNTHILGTFGASKKTGETFGTLTTVTAPSTFTTALGPIASLY